MNLTVFRFFWGSYILSFPRPRSRFLSPDRPRTSRSSDKRRLIKVAKVYYNYLIHTRVTPSWIDHTHFLQFATFTHWMWWYVKFVLLDFTAKTPRKGASRGQPPQLGFHSCFLHWVPIEPSLCSTRSSFCSNPPFHPSMGHGSTNRTVVGRWM